jgi:iron(III) transport system ATP-binding protein
MALMSLILRGVRHSYGQSLAVDGVDLIAAPGEIVCLVGPSGCGKTTVLRIAAGLERPVEGVVELDGEVLSSRQTHTPPERRRIGLVFQDFVLFPHMTVAENIAFGLSELGSRERAERISHELSAVGLNGLADRRPHQLSGGQQQRAALARAFARQPRAMLLDEPFASIDAALRRRLRAEMRRLLKARGAPTILVTHDPEEAVELGDRIAVMRAGRVVEEATPEELFRAPRTSVGALIFPGAQAIACEIAGGAAMTSFGALPCGEAPLGARVAVVFAGGATVVPDESGAARVVDCRFQGPGYQVSLTPADQTSPVFNALSDRPLTPGTIVAVQFDPGRVRVFAA